MSYEIAGLTSSWDLSAPAEYRNSLGCSLGITEYPRKKYSSALDDKVSPSYNSLPNVMRILSNQVFRL